MSRPCVLFWIVVAVLAVAHLAADPATEPFYYNDETRHVMTGVFVRDALADLPASAANPKGYAVRYYGQYPALGLLTWPPLFYAAEGTAMVAFGTSFVVARVLIGLSGLLAGWYMFRLVGRTHGPWAATGALALLGFAPEVYEHTRRVMLEMPTIAFVLAAVFHFERYLDEERRCDALLACLCAAAAALTRFDAVLLIPFVLVRLAARRKFGLLLRKPVVVGVLLALILTLPYYLFTWSVYRTGLTSAATEAAGGEPVSVFTLRHLLHYPCDLPLLVGWPLTIAAVLGLLAALFRRGGHLGAYVGLAVATYATFTPMAELDRRHAIYWAPAVAVFATELVMGAARVRPVLGVAVGVAVFGGTAWDTFTRPAYWVAGYDDAARYTVAHSTGDRPVMMDGMLNGAFIYYTRRADPGREVWVLRGDKLLYSMFSDPKIAYTEYATTAADVLAVLHAHDPELIVVEQPQIGHPLRGAELLREVLRENPDRFRLEHSVPIRSNRRDLFGNVRLDVYRKLDRNPNPVTSVEIPVFGLGGSLKSGR